MLSMNDKMRWMERIEADGQQRHVPKNMQAVRLILDHHEEPEPILDRTLRGSYWLAAVPVQSGGGAACWITPKGMVYGIQFGDHNFFMSMMKLNYADTERAGWMHVSGGRADLYYTTPTVFQRRAVAELEGLGLINERNFKDRTTYEAFQGAPSPDVKSSRYDERPRSDYNWRDPRWWATDANDAAFQSALASQRPASMDAMRADISF